MKIKNNFVLREVADTWVVLPLSDRTLDFSGMLTLNETGALLWQTLQQDCDLDRIVHVLTAEYAVSADQARIDAVEFLEKLISVGCLEYEAGWNG